MPTSFSDAQRAWAERKERASRSGLSDLLVRAYALKPLRASVVSLACRLEGGRFFSATLRRILSEYHRVKVGRYSYGPCLSPDALPPGTTVGAYCSIAAGLSVHRRNHPEGTLSQHPFFYNSALGLVEFDTVIGVEDNPLRIGNDVWIGDRVTILPGCRVIGDGAIIGAGSIVTRCVDPFTVVAGAPAKPLRRRYPPETIELLQRSRWWELSLPELLGADALLTGPMQLDHLRRFVDSLSQGRPEPEQPPSRSR